ncbi:LysR family transcriptional regulator [Kineosporia succinea]|uniref:DNA-binding transcriptional LysR family regulator n=1 Tax=Kineosporia succinea TaxID=84632 RepID=A0ABT9PBT0_9ACTN|nr:LysR family transcriptional regulator [Kineosporia succinea]MDP9829966.1 DNA-binding transcriptional LysR family regulator [Kineosporia succinea]
MHHHDEPGRPDPGGLRKVLSALPLLTAVVDTGGISAAADELGVPQSTVSRGLARLEAELGCTLLERDGRGVRLTAAGAEFAGAARRALDLIGEAVAQVRDDEARRDNRVSIVFQNSLGRAVIPALVKALVERRPGTQVDLRQGGRAYCLAEFDAGADLVLVAPPAQPDQGVLTVPLYTEHLVLAVPGTHRFAGRDAIALPELENEPTLVLAPAYGLRVITDSLLREAGVRVTRAFEGEDLATIRGLVAAGLGVSIVPPIGPAPDVVEVPIDDRRATREVAASWRTDAPRRPALAALVDVVAWDRSWLPEHPA